MIGFLRSKKHDEPFSLCFVNAAMSALTQSGHFEPVIPNRYHEFLPQLCMAYGDGGARYLRRLCFGHVKTTLQIVRISPLNP